MPFDFAAGLVSTDEEKVIDPEDIFTKQASGKNLWLGQGDALRDWFKHRDNDDILIGLDTGMGKTIIGLLVAYSMMNEKNKKTIYVCASKQLVEQTLSEAKSLGLSVATYIDSKFTNEFEFYECNVPLVTTYQALFNGKSKFAKGDIGGLVFDDSHVADTVIKDSFTLNIKREHDLYEKLTSLFAGYFKMIKQDARYKQVLEQKNDEVFILPPMEVKTHLEIITNFFNESDISDNTDTLFNWAHIKDNLDMCLFLVNQNRIEITPPIIPAKTLSYFKDGVSRVYLSATHVSTDYFPRYYGNKIDHSIVLASGKSKSKKFIISPFKSEIDFDSAQSIRETLMEHLHSFRSLIITPSFSRAKPWNKIDSSQVLEAKSYNIVEKINEFKSSDNKKLILANRYDGIDFPGNSCRALILDGLPSESALLDNYFLNQLKADNYIRTEMNAKILQGIGRIFRGADDYGIVFIIGKKEIRWISTPKNMMNFPPLMQVQLKVGNTLNQMVSEESFPSLISQILNNHLPLMKAYEKFIDEETRKMETFDTEALKQEQELMEKMSLIESHLFSSLWQRDYENIERLNQDLLNISKEFDSTIFSWHNFIVGLTLLVLDDEENSINYFYEANRISKITPKPLMNLDRNFTESKVGLANTIMSAITNTSKGSQERKMEQEFKFLDARRFPGEDKKHELSIEAIGKCLGFITDRPDNRLKTGPDILWELPRGKFAIIELKTNKTTGVYSKKETGQFLDHVEWLKREKEIKDKDIMYKIIVGPRNTVNHDANPSDDIYIIELDEFRKFADDIITTSITCYSPTYTTAKQVEELVSSNRLDWNKQFDKMHKVKAIDLKTKK